MFADGDRSFIPKVFGWVMGCFHGRHPEYQPIDARYHDLEHTLQGAVCLSALFWGRHVAGELPRMSRPQFELVILAILFHDSGYLKKRDDTTGTGAKYTATHVQRSCDFAALFLEPRGYGLPAIRKNNIHHCHRRSNNYN